MQNFTFQNSTKIHFGRGEIAKLDKEIDKKEKVLLLYGGGSIKKNSIYDQVMDALSEHSVIEFGGIPPNPEYDILIKALDVIKKENITYLLAVGGGSVIDGTKFIAAATLRDSDPWSIITDGKRIHKAMPFGTVLTLPATGSEMNSYSVVSRRATGEKRSFGGPGVFPQFSILDPLVIRSIPKRQIANGIADAFTHVLEQYMTYPSHAYLQDRFAESIIQTLIEIAPRVLAHEYDYEAAANYMWCCTMALNELLSKGVPTDWAIHGMGHELTAMYGIDHARTLAIIAGSHYTCNIDRKRDKLAQYGERIWGLTPSNTIAEQAIEKTVAFYQSLGIDTKLSDYTDTYAGTAETIAKRFEERGWKGIGEYRDLSPADVKEIVKMAY